MGLTLLAYEARSTGEFDGVFATMVRDRAEALLLMSDSLFGTESARIDALLAKHRMPSIHGARSNVEAGGLLLYGPNIPGQVRQAVGHVDRILKGAKPAELPVEQPTKYDLVVNLKTAKALDVTLPRALLLRADQVIE